MLCFLSHLAAVSPRHLPGRDGKEEVAGPAPSETAGWPPGPSSSRQKRASFMEPEEEVDVDTEDDSDSALELLKGDYGTSRVMGEGVLSAGGGLVADVKCGGVANW